MFINRHPKDSDLRVFAVLQALFLTGMSWYLTHRYGGPDAIPWGVASVFSVVGVFGLVQPRRLRWYYLGWMTVVAPIGWVVSRVMLGVVFFGIICPISSWLRLSGKIPLDRKWDPNAKTYWRERQEPTNKASYFRQF